ncbi:hypothetical protein ABZV78_00870 [Micromonospora sp. NPDC004540]|uniref:hypothetical protein n=1 Tax=Micromonospora sp. NPDC004540 TaxID=3154457 RepID=UPI0033B0CFBF
MGLVWIAAGVIALEFYGFVATFQLDPNVGRILADDVIGAAICLIGVTTIMYAPRSS